MPEPWIQTLTGHPFPILSATSADIRFPEIAEALSKICRFNGHCRGFYSVAQHSVLVADIVQADTGATPYTDDGREMLLYALLHDAHEAYISDIITPVKQALGMDRAITEATDRLDAAIFAAAGLPVEMPGHVKRAVKNADLTALMTEKRDLLTDAPACSFKRPPFKRVISAQSWVTANDRFMAKFRQLTQWPANGDGIGRGAL